mmetsp:Transcript_7823/g.22288  ORF Transcript_7823/g.22288 Transcript_7823/m.22288 type:complete len:209 (+) Transcript_7823:2103-2729(+)
MVGVADKHGVQRVNEPLVIHHVGVKVIHLVHSHDRCSPDICFMILQTNLQRVYQVLEKVCNPERAESAQRQAAQLWIHILAVLLEGVDSQEHIIRVGGGVSLDVLVQHLFQDQVLVAAREHHLCEERRHVYADRHVVDHLAEMVPLFSGGLRPTLATEPDEGLLQLCNLPRAFAISVSAGGSTLRGRHDAIPCLAPRLLSEWLLPSSS